MSSNNHRVTKVELIATLYGAQEAITKAHGVLDRAWKDLDYVKEQLKQDVNEGKY